MSHNENTELINRYLEEVRTLSTIATNLSDYLVSTNRDMSRIINNRIYESRSVESTSPFLSTPRMSTPFYMPPRRTSTRPPPLPIRPRTRTNRITTRQSDQQDDTNDEVVFTGLLDLTPVSVYPSITQVMNATEMHTFRDIENPINSSCPITMENFLETDRVCQIKHCKHIFKERSLYTWFSNHVGCPVCRFDIRNDPNNRDTENENYTSSVTASVPPIPEQLMNDITQLLSHSITRTVGSSTDV